MQPPTMRWQAARILTQYPRQLRATGRDVSELGIES